MQNTRRHGFNWFPFLVLIPRCRHIPCTRRPASTMGRE
jgi:hypothetical protein